MKTLEKIVGTAIGIIFSIVSTGCSLPNPQSGAFKEKVTVDFPHHPVIIALNAGEIQAKKIYDDEKMIGFEVTKKHWLVGETGTQEIYFPSGAENIGIETRPGIFDIEYWASFDLNEKKYMHKYTVNKNGSNYKLSKEYIWNNKKQKWDSRK